MIRILFLLLAFLFGCSTTTKIRTNRGVGIYIDEVYKGKGVIKHSDAKIAFSETEVLLRKKGCEDDYKYITKNRFRIGIYMFAYPFVIPLLWSFGYYKGYHFPFSCFQD